MGLRSSWVRPSAARSLLTFDDLLFKLSGINSAERRFFFSPFSSNSSASGSITPTRRAMAARCCWRPTAGAGRQSHLSAMPTLSSYAVPRPPTSARSRRSTVRGLITFFAEIVIWAHRFELLKPSKQVVRNVRSTCLGSGGAGGLWPVPSIVTALAVISANRPAGCFEQITAAHGNVDLPEPDDPITK